MKIVKKDCVQIVEENSETLRDFMWNFQLLKHSGKSEFEQLFTTTNFGVIGYKV